MHLEKEKKKKKNEKRLNMILVIFDKSTNGKQ